MFLPAWNQTPNRADLEDSRTALELTLSEGVSRYQERGGGMVFDRCLLASKLAQFIRYRSSDHGRITPGPNPACITWPMP